MTSSIGVPFFSSSRVNNGGPPSWNLRGRHMFKTLKRLLEAGGSDSKAVAWAHNSHIGDTRHSDTGIVGDGLNIGHVVRGSAIRMR